MKLTTRQKNLLDKHSEHHSVKHMEEMKKLMLKGKTFNEAHNLTMKKVGK